MHKPQPRLVTGHGWIEIDAKRIGQGRLVVDERVARRRGASVGGGDDDVGMPIIQHGTPGASIDADGVQKYGSSDARVGAWFERQVAHALESWLACRAEEVHVFHDLTGLDSSVASDGFAVGQANIDHLILTGHGWIMLDAKRTGQGRLVVDEHGHGMLVTPDGTSRPQPWLDHRRAYSRAGALYRLTGLRGELVWVLPEATDYAPLARRPPICMHDGGTFLSVTELAAGELDALDTLPPPYAPPDPAHLAALQRHTDASRTIN